MNIAVFGLWHLGAVTAAGAASLGHHVRACDPDPTVVDLFRRGATPVAEPGLTELMAKEVAAGRLEFTNDLAASVGAADVVWVAFDTPVDEHDHGDAAFVLRQVESVFPHLRNGSLVLVSSQLPVGSTRALEAAWAKVADGRTVSFACSPENLRLGGALEVFLSPDRIVVGVRDVNSSRETISRLFGPLADRIVWMRTESAEMTKHAVNAFLATSVTFINELARICELVDADASEVERGLKSEARIGLRAYLGPGAAFAGGTLARDVQFLRGLGRRLDRPTPLLDGLWQSNTTHRAWTVQCLLRQFGSFNDRRIAVWGLTYKAGTTALRRSDAVVLCHELATRGATVVAHDPTVVSKPTELGDQIHIAADAIGAARGADALVVTTGWPVYREIPGDAIASAMRRPLVLDANRFLDRTIGNDDRIEYVSVGRPARGQ